MKTKSHLKLRALCEGAIMVALAYVLSFIKLFELPQGGSIDIGMLPIFLYCARWGFGPGLLASFVYSFLQLLQGGGFVIGWQSILGDYIVGATIWAAYMPDTFFGMTMTSPWFYSALYNGSYMLVDMIVCVVVGWALWKPLGKYIRGEDLQK